jgi:hypothetical protein
VARPHIVTRVVVAPPVRWYVHRAPQFHAFVPSRVVHGGPTIRPYRPVPESQRPPFVHSGGSPIIHSGGAPIVHSAPLPHARIDGGHASSGGTSWHGHAGSSDGGWHGHGGRH